MGRARARVEARNTEPAIPGGKGHGSDTKRMPSGRAALMKLVRGVRGVRGLFGRAGGLAVTIGLLRGLSDMRNRLRFGYLTRNRNDIEMSYGLCSYACEHE